MIKTTEKQIKRGTDVYKKISLYLTGGTYDKHIGDLLLKRGQRIYYKKVNSTKHKMKLFDGYGIQKEVYDKYLRGKKGLVVIDEIDTGRRLKAEIKVWDEHSRQANYGEAKQVFLSVKYMKSFTPIIV